MKSEKDTIREKLFIKEEDALKRLEEILSRVKKYVKVEENTGKIILEEPNMTIEQKIFLVLTARYFSHKVAENIPETATMSEMSQLLAKPSSSLTKQLNALIEEDFIERVSKGTYKINYYRIDEYLDEIEGSAE